MRKMISVQLDIEMYEKLKEQAVKENRAVGNLVKVFINKGLKSQIRKEKK